MAPPYPDPPARRRADATRRPSAFRAAWGLGLVALWFAPARAGAPAAEPLTGPAAWQRVVGNTVAGTTPDGSYTEFFAPDGGLRLSDRDGTAEGRWTLRDGKLCTQVVDDEEECRGLDVSGAAGAFTDEAGTRYTFVILPGDPKRP